MWKLMRLAAIFAVCALVLPAQSDPNLDRNKRLAREFLEQVWFQGHAEAAVKYFASDYITNDPRRGFNLKEQPDMQVRIAGQTCVENYDCSHSKILFETAEGDRVSVSWILVGSPRKLGLSALAATFGQSPMEIRVMNVMRFDSMGKIIEFTSLRDDLGAYTAMGVFNLALLSLFVLGAFAGMGLFWLIARNPFRRPAVPSGDNKKR